MNNLSCFVPSWFALNLDGFSCLKKNLSGIVLLTKPKVNFIAGFLAMGLFMIMKFLFLVHLGGKLC